MGFKGGSGEVDRGCTRAGNGGEEGEGGNNCGKEEEGGAGELDDEMEVAREGMDEERGLR